MHQKVHYNNKLKLVTRLLHSNLRPKHSNLRLDASWFYTLWWLNWSIVATTSVYSPLRLQATTYSPHMGLILSQPQSATPSGVPQYKQQPINKASHQNLHPKLYTILFVAQFNT